MSANVFTLNLFTEDDDNINEIRDLWKIFTQKLKNAIKNFKFEEEIVVLFKEEDEKVRKGLTVSGYNINQWKLV
jgi:hypothetical protein